MNTSKQTCARKELLRQKIEIVQNRMFVQIHYEIRIPCELTSKCWIKKIALPDLLLESHELKRHIAIAIQAMFLACYNRRQERRQECLVETFHKCELEGEPTQGEKAQRERKTHF